MISKATRYRLEHNLETADKYIVSAQIVLSFYHQFSVYEQKIAGPLFVVCMGFYIEWYLVHPGNLTSN